MIIKKSEISNVSVDFYKTHYDEKNWIIENSSNPGEHYKLLKYIGSLYDNIQIIDAGTAHGYSCFALAQNKNNKIITYDISDKTHLNLNKYSNIEVKKLDINKEKDDVIKNSHIIFLDVDPHNGLQEIEFYRKLTNMKYNGIVICDDINLNSEMKRFWSIIKEEKYDISEVGHFSGTGIVNFSEQKIEII